MALVNRLRLAWYRLYFGRRIRRHGWAGVYVGNYNDPPTWAYTLGLDQTLDHPEIIVFDVKRKDGTFLLSHIFNELRAGRLVIEEGLAWAEATSPSVWREVHPDHTGEWLPLANFQRYWTTGRGDGVRAFQLVLSDSEGVLPWEPGYKEVSRQFQPALWLAPRGVGPRVEALGSPR